MNDNYSPLSGQWDELFGNVEALNAHALQSSVEISKVAINDYDISGSTLPIASFEKTRWENVTAKNTNFGNLIVRDSVIVGTSFYESIIVTAVFENVIFEDVNFVGATLSNVKFINCKLFNTRVRNMKPSKVEIIDSQTMNSPFFESTIDLKIVNSKIEDSNCMGLGLGSSINIEKSSLSYVNFDDSNLTSFTATDSELKKTKVQDCNIGKVVLTNSTLDISFADSSIEKVRISETQSELLGFVDTNVNDMSISFCKKGSDISLTGLKFNNLQIANCNHVDFMIPEGVGKDFIVSNTILKMARFRAMAVDYLLLDNVEFTGETNFDDAKAKKSEVRNIKRGPGATVTAQGSNIKFY